MPPDAAIVRRFTVALRGANRANDMTAMIAAPVTHTTFAAPARVKLDFAAGRQHREQERCRRASSRRARASIQR